MNFTYEVQISCTPARLIGLIAETLAETMGNEKAVDLVPGRSDQQLSERGSEVAGGVTCEDPAGRRDSSTTSISVSHMKVNERGRDAY